MKWSVNKSLLSPPWTRAYEENPSAIMILEKDKWWKWKIPRLGHTASKPPYVIVTASTIVVQIIM